jgi:signal transduction histidine kinase
MGSGKAGFEIKISDNGKGLNSNIPREGADSAPTASGDGLNNMRKRLADIGGHCTIESTAGQGTNIKFLIPFNSFTNGH